jgi:hypothetical protein
METEFYLPETFPTHESAIEAGIQAGRQKIDVGFERGSVASTAEREFRYNVGTTEREKKRHTAP